MTWKVFAATAIGKSHIDGELPCQDALAHRCVGDVLVAVVCDGAGSCALSHIGAAALSTEVSDRLAQGVEAGTLSPAMPNAVVFEAVADAVAAVRARFEAEAVTQGGSFSDYSATMVGVIANGQGGCFFHIGDGLGVAQAADAEAAPVVSLPENGEYANETYFFTGELWREHLRLTNFPAPITTLALMSDGAMPFVMAKNHTGFHRPFIDPVTRYLASVAEDEGSQALAGTLADPRTYLITGDDKALLLALWS